MEAVGIRSREGFLSQILVDEVVAEPASSVPPGMIDALEHYQETQDINALLSLTALWPTHELVRVIDSNTRKGFLLIYRDGRILPFVASLSYSPGERHFVRATLPLDADDVRKFVDSTAVFLFLHNEE